MRLMLNQKGLSPVVVVGIVLLVIISGGTYYFLDKTKNQPRSIQSEQKRELPVENTSLAQDKLENTISTYSELLKDIEQKYPNAKFKFVEDVRNEEKDSSIRFEFDKSYQKDESVLRYVVNSSCKYLLDKNSRIMNVQIGIIVESSKAGDTTHKELEVTTYPCTQ